MIKSVNRFLVDSFISDLKTKVFASKSNDDSDIRDLKKSIKDNEAILKKAQKANDKGWIMSTERVLKELNRLLSKKTSGTTNEEITEKNLAKSGKSGYNLSNKSETPTGETVMAEAYTTYLDDSNHRWGASKAIIDGHKLVGVCGTNNVMERYLYELNDYDKQELYANKVVLKKDEAVFRFSNRTIEMGGLFPLIKINTKKGLAYFLTDAAMSGETGEIEFKTKGEKLAWFRTTDRNLTIN